MSGPATHDLFHRHPRNMTTPSLKYPKFPSLNSTKFVSRTTRRFFKVKAAASSSDSGAKDDPAKLALDKAKAYKKQLHLKNEGSSSIVERNDGSVSKGGDGDVSGPLNKENVKKRINKKVESTISSIDFVGLGFSDKKQSRGLPPGLVPVTETFPEGDLPEVEIIVGDTSKFGDAAAASNRASTLESTSQLYKPKVSTWGVFPRPKNISQTYGGGKVIRPGEVLETAEEKAAKEAKTRQLLAAYKQKVGLQIDPKLKSECEKALKDGDSLMDLGKLEEALPFYEKVMEKLGFQTELHGLAALQWSICKDSLNRPVEAQAMYEKLQSHTNYQVSKKARVFMFGFQAMEMMKVKSTSSSPTKTGYQNYFEAFVEKKANYSLKDAEADEDAIRQALPYVMFLVSPIFAILVVALQKRV